MRSPKGASNTAVNVLLPVSGSTTKGSAAATAAGITAKSPQSAARFIRSPCAETNPSTQYARLSYTDCRFCAARCTPPARGLKAERAEPGGSEKRTFPWPKQADYTRSHGTGDYRLEAAIGLRGIFFRRRTALGLP